MAVPAALWLFSRHILYLEKAFRVEIKLIYLKKKGFFPKLTRSSIYFFYFFFKLTRRRILKTKFVVFSIFIKSNLELKVTRREILKLLGERF